MVNSEGAKGVTKTVHVCATDYVITIHFYLSLVCVLF
jgi:hypothetical protein